MQAGFLMQKLRFSTSILLHHVLSTVRPPSVIQTAAPDRGKLMTLVAGKPRRLFIAGDGHRRLNDKKAQRYAENNRTLYKLIVRSDKYDAAIFIYCLFFYYHTVFMVK